MNKIVKRGLLALGILFLIFMFVRIVSHTEIDDVHPNIECHEIQEYNPDVLWVIPLFEGVGISNNSEWCKEILLLNKTIGMHGISHTYQEFRYSQSYEDLNRGIEEFEACFGYRPEMFKPPQLFINAENKQLIKENDLKLKWIFNQGIHKVYHCNNQGMFPNWLSKVF